MAAAANVKPSPISDTLVSETSPRPVLVAFHEQLGEEIHGWIDRVRTRDNQATRPALLTALARTLGLTNERQLYRYMSGETPFPAEKLVPLCRAIGSWTLLEALCQEGELLAGPKPGAEPLTSFDVIVEQAHTVKEFGELVVAHADAMSRPVNAEDARRIDREAGDAIRHIERLRRNYREMFSRRQGAR